APYATFLKVGTTARVLDALMKGIDEERIPTLADPVKTIRRLSRDRTWKWECVTSEERPTTALAVQQQYLELVREADAEDSDGCLQAWEDILVDLEKDPRMTADRLDWAAKHHLIESFREAEGLTDEDPWLQSLDLNYHLLDVDEGLFFALQQQGAFRDPPGHDPERDTTGMRPPPTTRAAVRGLCLEKFGNHINSAQWDHVRLKTPLGLLELDLRQLFDPREIRSAITVITGACSPEELEVLPFAKRL
ncbi:MAG: proteasome accessory factor PafA2 family protein, partial [Verrucomicrobiota bacterium]